MNPSPTAPAFRRPLEAIRLQPGRTLLALFLLGLLALILLWDWNWLRGPIERVVHAQTGREFDIGGDLDVDLGRVTRVRMDAVRFGNASWSKPADMATTQRVEFRIELLPAILRRELLLPELRMTEPRVTLEMGPGSVGNWVFGDQKPSGKPLQLRSLWIDKGRMQYVDAKGRTDVDITLQSQPLQEGQASPSLAVDGGGSWKGNRFKLRGTGESPLELQDSDRPYRLDLRASALNTHAHARGTILDPVRFRGFDLKLALSGRNLDDLYPLLGVALPPSPPYSIDGRLTRTINSPTSSTWRYDGFTGRVGDSDLAGLAHVTTGKRLFLKADLRSRRLDFDDLAGFVGGAPQGKGKEDSNPELRALAAKQAASPRLLPDTPYELDKLQAMDADVRLRAARINAPKLPLDDMDAHLFLDRGVLRLQPLNFGVAGGDIRSTIRMNASENPIRTRADITLRGLNLRGLMPDNELAQGAVGRLGGDVKLSTRGNSVAKMLGTADGRVGVRMGEGQISKLLMKFASIDLAGILRIKLTRDKQIPIRCVYGDFGVDNGVMTVRDLAFDTSETVLRGEGTVNLRDETLDLTIRPRPRKFSPLSLRTPLYVRGTFKQPEFKPDYMRMGLRGGAAIALGIVAAPAAALVATTDIGRERGSRCGGNAK